jgi:catechol 2,3-dioxygenase-like lactoylglutathione lyase family enzyme
VTAVRSVEVQSPAPDQALKFYRDVWHLSDVVAVAGVHYLRGTVRYHHIFSLAAGAPAIRRIVFDAPDRAAVNALHQRISKLTDQIEEPQACSAPGGGYGFGFRDPEARNFAILCDVADHASAGHTAADRPHKISHVNLNARDYDQTTRFLVEALGFRLIDETGRARFFHASNPDHFSIAVVKATNVTLNHIAFELPDLDSVMRGGGRMRDAGYPIEWGVGRHGPGDNVFAYFAGPDELPIEYTSEMLQIDDGYVPRGPDYWKFPAGRSDQWGITGPQSARFARIQALFAFVGDFRLKS